VVVANSKQPGREQEHVEASFGSRLKGWRQRRGLSQLELAMAAEVSQRHVSFLELGRTAPSREMVLRLAAALALPLRQQNALLLAAGFSPQWREGSLAAPELAQVNQALDYMLQQQDPYPAFVLDRRWNLLRTNRGGRHLVAFLTDSPASEPQPPINLAQALVAPDQLRPLIANWREVVIYFLRGIANDALVDGSEETAALLERLRAHPGVPKSSELSLDDRQDPILAIHFVKGKASLKLFTTLATLGTPQHVTAQEIRIECFFPADAETAGILKEWAARSPL
jgi:transcriptional regulator with XRE-family HTH domain